MATSNMGFGTVLLVGIVGLDEWSVCFVFKIKDHIQEVNSFQVCIRGCAKAMFGENCNNLFFMTCLGEAEVAANPSSR